MVTFVPGFLSAKVAQHNRERQLVEAANLESSKAEGKVRMDGMGQGTPRPPRDGRRRRRPHRPHQESRGHRSHRPRRRLRWHHERSARPRRRLEVSGADGRTLASRLQGRRGQEDPRPQHPARDAPGRESVGEAAEGARGVADAVYEVVPRARAPRKDDLDHPHHRARRFDHRRHAGVPVAARGAPERARRRDEPVRVLADEVRAASGRS